MTLVDDENEKFFGHTMFVENSCGYKNFSFDIVREIYLAINSNSIM